MGYDLESSLFHIARFYLKNNKTNKQAQMPNEVQLQEPYMLYTETMTTTGRYRHNWEITKSHQFKEEKSFGSPDNGNQKPKAYFPTLSILSWPVILCVGLKPHTLSVSTLASPLLLSLSRSCFSSQVGKTLQKQLLRLLGDTISQ